MQSRSFLLSLCLVCTMAQAADPLPAPEPRPAPPRWRQAVPVSVIIGADVAASVDAQGFPTTLILRIKDLSKLPAPIPNAVECVFDAQAWSNLSSERVVIRPRQLRCFDAQDKELPGKAVSGFAVDKDARVGIKSPMLWGAAAKELLLIGVGAQAKQGFFARIMSSTASRVSYGLSNDIMGGDDDKTPVASADAIREIRSTETLLPTLTLEPGKEFDIVLQGPRQQPP